MHYKLQLIKNVRNFYANISIRVSTCICTLDRSSISFSFLPPCWKRELLRVTVTLVSYRITETYCTYNLESDNTANNNCVATDSSAIVVNPLPPVNAGNDVITCIGFPVQLSATGASFFSWTPANLLDDATKANPVATTDSSTTFIVKGTDSTGCYAFDSVNVIVSANSVAAFQVPNAFTPNGDGINDCFGIRKWGNVTVEYFQIYNRWGQLIFSTKDPSQCWDGTFNGQKQDAGGYPYIIKVKSPCGEITRKGMLLLIR